MATTQLPWCSPHVEVLFDQYCPSGQGGVPCANVARGSSTASSNTSRVALGAAPAPFEPLPPAALDALWLLRHILLGQVDGLPRRRAGPRG